MGLIDIASNNSLLRGIDYYRCNDVISWKKIDEGIYQGVVAGSNKNQYSVYVDKNHPRKSRCNCPFAEGRRVICKHMLALYFTAEPETAANYVKEVEEREEKEDRKLEKELKRRKKFTLKLQKYVNSLSKKELRKQLYSAMLQLDKIDEDYWK